MHCKHLLHYSYGTHTWSVASCSAKNTPYVPSLGEVKRFCQSGRHIVCPAYLFSCEGGSAKGKPHPWRDQQQANQPAEKRVRHSMMRS